MADALWDNAAFGVGSPAETAEKAPNLWDKLFSGAVNSLATLPQRAIENSQNSLNTGNYDPSVPMEAAMTLTGGAGAIPAEANSLRMGIKAYHGSPHDFDAFSMDKIGTGEGAQAYGHGLYFADNEGVARSYRDTLAGRQLDWASPEAAAKYDPGTLAALEKDLRGRTPDEVMALNKQYSDHAKETGRRSIMADMHDALKNGDLNKGHMYEVNINADPAHFLDWDKPLSEQSRQAQDSVRAAYEKRSGFANVAPYLNGQEVSKLLGDKAEAATALRDAGIPGIKYLDQGSRGAGQGSSNYVVFDDKIIDLMRKYGLALPGGAAAADVYTRSHEPAT